MTFIIMRLFLLQILFYLLWRFSRLHCSKIHLFIICHLHRNLILCKFFIGSEKKISQFRFLF